jgi:hypothetical protein
MSIGNRDRRTHEEEEKDGRTLLLLLHKKYEGEK